MANQAKKSKKMQNDYVQYLRTKLEIQYLSQKYRKAHEWIPRLAIDEPKLTSEQALKNVHDRLSKLRASFKRHRKIRLSQIKKKATRKQDFRRSLPIQALPPDKRFLWFSAGSPQYTMQYAEEVISLDQYLRETGLGINLGNIPSAYVDRIDGIARATGFREYIWSEPDDWEDENHLLLPLGTNDIDNFTDATGIQFLAELTDSDVIGFAAILQYTLPEAPWNGALQWSLSQHFEIPEVICSADWGYFTLVSCGRQCPSGEDFPADAMAFGLEYILPIIQANGEDFYVGPIAATDRFYSGCPISKGQRPRIYIGFSIFLWSEDGSLSLGDPCFAHHGPRCLGEGLSYSLIRL